MEDAMPMSYNLILPSLKHTTLIKIAANLWNQSDVWISTSPRLGEQVNRSTLWSSREKVLEKVPKLLLPESLSKELMRVVIFLGHEIVRWKCSLSSLFMNMDWRSKGIVYSICWTSNGMLDQKKTAEALIKNESFDIAIRFKLACDCCLEDDIKALWNKMPLNIKICFYGEEQTDLVTYWTCVIKRIPETYSISYLFWRAVYSCNKVAADYFLQKLTPEQRERELVSTAKEVLRSYPIRYRCNSDIVWFLLSHMNKNQQTEVFKKFPYEVLLSFLDLPSERFFLETAKHLWDFLSKSEYKDLLEDIVDKVIHGHKDCNYRLLFSIFWQRNSVSKKFDINRWTIAVLLPKLFEADFAESIRLILNNTTFVKKDEFIFSPCGKIICEFIIKKRKWHLISLFVGECLSSKELIVKFRNECDMWSLSKPEYKQKLLQLLDDLIKSYD